MESRKEFGKIVVKQTATAIVRVKDIATVELAAQDYTTNSYLDLDPAIAIGTVMIVDKVRTVQRIPLIVSSQWSVVSS